MKCCNIAATITTSYDGFTNTKVLLKQVLYCGRCNCCHFEGSTNSKQGLNEVLYHGRSKLCTIFLAMTALTLALRSALAYSCCIVITASAA